MQCQKVLYQQKAPFGKSGIAFSACTDHPNILSDQSLRLLEATASTQDFVWAVQCEKYCDYYQDSGHNTEDYKKSKDFI